MNDWMRHAVCAVVVLTLALVFVIPAQSQTPLEEEEIAGLRARAEGGDAEAQFRLGLRP